MPATTAIDVVSDANVRVSNRDSSCPRRNPRWDLPLVGQLGAVPVKSIQQLRHQLGQSLHVVVEAIEA